MVATTAAVRVIADWDGKDLSRGMTQVDKDMDRLKGNLKRMAPVLRSIGALMGVAVGFQMAKQVIATADAWKGYQNRINLFTKTAKETAEVQQRLFNIAQRTRTEMGSTVELYQRFSIANKALKLDQAELGQIIETVNQALIISGGSSESANAAVIQLGQGLASGTLRGEELNSVLEQAPRLAMAIAAGMGVQIGKLRELGAEGKITALQVIESLQSQQGVVAAEFGKMEMTVGGAWVKLTDAVGLYISKLNEAVGATSALAKAMSAIAESVSEAAVPTPLPTTMSREGQDVSDFFGVSSVPGQGAGPGFFSRKAAGTFVLPPGQRNEPRLIGETPLAARRKAALGDSGLPDKAMDDLIEAITTGIKGMGPLKLGTWAQAGLDAEVDAALSNFFKGAGRTFLEGDIKVAGAGPRITAVDPFLSGGQMGRPEGTLDIRNAIIRGFGEVAEKGLDFQDGGIRGISTGTGPTKQLGLLGGLQSGQGTPEQINLQARAAAAQTTAETKLLSIRQAAEMALAVLDHTEGAYVDTLKDVHRAEMVQLKDALVFKATSEKDAEDRRAEEKEGKRRRREQLQAQEDFNRAIVAGQTILSRINPELDEFFRAVSKLAQGDFLGAAVDGIGLLTDALFGQSKAQKEYEQQLERTRHTLQLAAQDAASFASSMGEEVSFELLTLQNEALKPLHALFQMIRESSPDDSLVQEMEKYFETLDVWRKSATEVGAAGVPMPQWEMLKDAVGGVQGLLDFFNNLDVAFGYEENRNLQEVGRKIFTVRDALEALGDAAGEISKPLQRAVTTTFDVREQMLRRHAGAAIGRAGGDVHAQAQVFATLKTSIDHLAKQETAELAALRAGKASDTTVARGTPPPSEDGGSVDYSGDIASVEKPWDHALNLNASTLEDFGVSGYADIIDFSGDIVSIEKPWHHALNFNASPLFEYGISHYKQIIAFGGNLTKIDKPWAHAIKMFQGKLTETPENGGWGISKYDQIIAYEGDVVKIPVPWAHAIKMFQGKLTEAPGEKGGWGISHYDQIIAYEGDVVKIPVPWANALDMTRKTIVSYHQLFDMTNIRPMAINVKDIVQLVGSRQKLSLRGLFDLSELDALIDSAVGKRSSNRTSGDARDYTTALRRTSTDAEKQAEEYLT